MAPVAHPLSPSAWLSGPWPLARPAQGGFPTWMCPQCSLSGHCAPWHRLFRTVRPPLTCSRSSRPALPASLGSPCCPGPRHGPLTLGYGHASSAPCCVPHGACEWESLTSVKASQFPVHCGFGRRLGRQMGGRCALSPIRSDSPRRHWGRCSVPHQE